MIRFKNIFNIYMSPLLAHLTSNKPKGLNFMLRSTMGGMGKRCLQSFALNINGIDAMNERYRCRKNRINILFSNFPTN